MLDSIIIIIHHLGKVIHNIKAIAWSISSFDKTNVSDQTVLNSQIHMPYSYCILN